jgi:hypothetical protein
MGVDHGLIVRVRAAWIKHTGDTALRDLRWPQIWLTRMTPSPPSLDAYEQRRFRPLRASAQLRLRVGRGATS